MSLGRATYEPGWKWSEHVGRVLGQNTCNVEHIGIVIQGRATAAMNDGRIIELQAGDIFHVAPGHDSWVIGDEPYVSLHLIGAGTYTKSLPESATGFPVADRLNRTIRENYDRLAKQYALHLFDELQHKPLDLELLTRFADQTRTRGKVCDLGCGPGHVTRFLNDLRVSVFGIDVSPLMVTEARRRNPGLEFHEGDMLALDLAPDSLAGMVAFYAIVNLAPRTPRNGFQSDVAGAPGEWSFVDGVPRGRRDRQTS